MAERETINAKPLHRLSWTEKQAKGKQYFKTAADYYLQNSHFSGVAGGGRRDLGMMYEVYNNKIPAAWFNHVTDPLSAQNAQHKKFPAKIRPTNILRTNIDLLLGEYPRRPFRYRVENVGEDGYNKYLDDMNTAVKDNVTKMFLAFAQQAAADQGASEDEISQITPDQVPMPSQVKEKFQVSYKDKQAIKGQKWLQRALIEHNIKRKLHKMFKDFLIAGEGVSYKNIHHGELEYWRLSPLYSDYDKSPDTDFIEDGEWFTHVFFMTASDVVDMFYDELTEDGHTKLEHYSVGQSSPSVMYDYLSKTITTEHQGKIPVYLCLWKGKKLCYYRYYPDPLTGEEQSEKIDEAEFNILTPEEKAACTKEWVNCVYETWRVGDREDGLYFRMQEVPAQRNAMNNFSVCKLPANGRKYSDTHAENISVLQIGIPYLIMYMIVGRKLELLIAKSKDKILMMDNNAIPRSKGWNEEKFFYYSEALGYALIDRNQIGVDKSFNQYQVVDMSLYDGIEQLIKLQQHFKQEWDDVIGISMQRKAKTEASETYAAGQQAIFQSTVITEMIFQGFDEFVERELQGLLDLSKFTNADGLRRLYNGSDTDDILLEIDPEDYCNAALGVFVTDDPQDFGALEMMKSQVGNMLQNGVKMSTIFELLQAGNISGLMSKLKQVEAIEAEMAAQEQENEADMQAAADERKLQFLEYEKMLEEQLMITQGSLDKELVLLEADIELSSPKEGEEAKDDSMKDIIKAQTEREKMMSQERIAEKNRVAQASADRLKAGIEMLKVKAEQEKAKREEARKDKEHAQKLQKGEQDIRKAKILAKKAAKPAPKKK